MVVPVMNGHYRGLAARVRLVVLFLASAIMIVGLSCSLALYAINKTGRRDHLMTTSSSSSSSFLLLHSFQRFMGFFLQALAVLCVLFLFTWVYTMVGKMNKIWQRNRRQACRELQDRSGDRVRSQGELDEGRDDSGKKLGSTRREEEQMEWDLEEGMKPAKLKELMSTRHIWDPETGASIKLPKWGIVP